jgi:hypothetical protein
MMKIVFPILMLAATAVIFWRGICLAATLNRHLWLDHHFKFVGFSASIALSVGGAVGVLLGWGCGQYLLLIGVAGWFFFDRRENR